ncbi:hypothetical protein QQ008_14300 [Fulvivirgaceae bacterium BMA10]|uniref:Anti-sigma factor n=1 Tax=Splendidivirga corallicola TaxID=3051826 RepID=A0ABT8KP89_9BACT|nr:hypothetical protein [Fulvivirgaceae bacterium BMA10]
MQDKLEKFIRDNRNLFDDREPGDVWEKIEKDLDTDIDKKKSIASVYWKVAAIFLLGVCTFLLIDKFNPDEPSISQQKMKLSPEFLETEAFYTQLISHKVREIENFRIEDPELKSTFRSDIMSLDSVYQNLKNELYETNNQIILDEMIENLRLRIDILSEQLMILKTINNEKNEEAHSL